MNDKTKRKLRNTCSIRIAERERDKSSPRRGTSIDQLHASGKVTVPLHTFSRKDQMSFHRILGNGCTREQFLVNKIPDIGVDAGFAQNLRACRRFRSASICVVHPPCSCPCGCECLAGDGEGYSLGYSEMSLNAKFDLIVYV